MTRELEGTAALVTGASSGIGEATARRLSELGAAVAVVARRRDRLETLAAEIDEKGGRVVVIEADVTEQSEAAGAVEGAVAELGRLDILVNNAGVMLLGPIAEAPLEEWERMVAVNVMGLLYCSQAALPHLLAAAENGQRQIADLVNVSSVAGRKANRDSGVYNLTKFGVGAFSESLRMELAKRHVRVSLVEPGFVKTELADHIRPELQEWSRQRYAGVERLESEDIADAICYVVTRPRRMAVNEVLVRPTEQEF